MKFTVPLFLAALLPLAALSPEAAAAKPPKAKPAEPEKPAAKTEPAPPKAQAVQEQEQIRIPAGLPAYNRMVLEAIRRMPSGGGYSISREATSKLVEASGMKKDARGGLGFQPATAQPSYCSGATYLVFLEVVSELIKAGRIRLSAAEIATLPVTRQLDGVGVWGRWNANGPGTGRFFYECRIGTNYEGLDKAKPGDFLKVWWNEHIGKRERGHSVVFLAHEKTPDGEPGIRFWSSNEPDGMGQKVIPLTKIKRALVSRLDHPENLGNLTKIAPKDGFLASMLEKDATREEYLSSIGLSPGAAATPATPPAAPEAAAAPPAGEEKIVVKLDGGPESTNPAAPAPAPAPGPPAAPKDAATVFLAGSPYENYTAASKLYIIEMIQMRLRYDGVYEGPIDGKPSAATLASLQQWQTNTGVPSTGKLDTVTLFKMGLNELAETKTIAPRSPAQKPATPAPAVKPGGNKVPVRRTP